MTQTLADLVQSKEQWEKKFSDFEAECTRQRDGLRADIALLVEQIEQRKAGLDESKILLAEHAIYVTGIYGPFGDDQAAVNAAISDIADGCTKEGYGRLRSDGLGTKTYDRFSHQRCDCSYSCGPRHGSIVFQIGLKREVRGRLEGGGELTADEKDAAIYYLMNLKAILSAKEVAKVS